MTTEQLRQLRMAVDTIYDVTQHMDAELPVYTEIALERLHRWVETGRAAADARAASSEKEA